MTRKPGFSELTRSRAFEFQPPTAPLASGGFVSRSTTIDGDAMVAWHKPGGAYVKAMLRIGGMPHYFRRRGSRWMRVSVVEFEGS